MVCVIRCLFFVMDGTGLIVGRNAFQFQYNLSTTWSCLSSVLLSQPIQIQTAYKTIWLRIFLSSPASSVPILRSSDYFPLFSGSVIFSYLIVSLCSLTGKCVARKESHALPLLLGQVSWAIVASRALLWGIVAPSMVSFAVRINCMHQWFTFAGFPLAMSSRNQTAPQKYIDSDSNLNLLQENK